jgi:enediyne biosynthesis protein E4
MRIALICANALLSIAAAAPNTLNPYGVLFHDATREAGIHFQHERAASADKLYYETMGAGVAFLDYNQDGYLDIFFVNSGYTPFFHPWQPPQPALYRNNGDGTFTDVTAASGIHADGTFFMGVAVGDYDNDGYPDIYMTGYRHSVLLHNNGDGTFTDVTGKAGVGDDGRWGTAAGWFDYDHDGKLDLLVTNYVAFDADHPVLCGENRPGYRAYCHPDSFHGESMRLYHNNGDGTFTDVTEKAGLANDDGKSLALVLADLNNDGWTDIFIANDTQRNFLYYNNGDGTFRDASYRSGAGFSEDGRPEAGMGVDAADLTNDGSMSLYVSHLDFELNRLYRANGDGTFTDETIASGLGQTNILNSSFGAKFLDFDNDGWRDLLVTNGHILDNIKLYHPEVNYEEERKLYRNVGQGRFVDATVTQPPEFRAPRVGRGLAVGDFDNDGWLDFVVNNNGEEAQLFRNEGASSSAARANHWLGVHLVGTKSNRDGIGARLKLVAGDFTSYDQAKGGMSYSSAQDPRIYFGLGAHARIDSLEVQWTSGIRDVIKNLAANQIITVTEGKGLSPYRYPARRVTGRGSTTAAHVDDPPPGRAAAAEDSWRRIPVPTTASFRGLSAVNADVVWASGSNGTVIRTIDGGKRWDVRVVAGADKLDFRGVHAFDADKAVIMSTGKAEDGMARIYRTGDGGKTWALVFDTKTPGVFFDSIAFWDRRRGIVLGDPVDSHFVLFRTNDGGSTWTRIRPASLPPALPGEGAFAASNSCIALEGRSNIWFVTGGASVARVFRSNDGGETWAVAETPLRPTNTSSGLFSIALRNSKVGIVVGGDYAQPQASPVPNVLFTSDGGKSWDAANEPLRLRSMFLSSVAFAPHPGREAEESVLRAVGPAGALVERTGSFWVLESKENFNAVAIPSRSVAWAVGPKGFVAKLITSGALSHDTH